MKSRGAKFIEGIGQVALVTRDFLVRKTTLMGIFFYAKTYKYNQEAFGTPSDPPEQMPLSTKSIILIADMIAITAATLDAKFKSKRMKLNTGKKKLISNLNLISTLADNNEVSIKLHEVKNKIAAIKKEDSKFLQYQGIALGVACNTLASAGSLLATVMYVNGVTVTIQDERLIHGFLASSALLSLYGSAYNEYQLITQSRKLDKKIEDWRQTIENKLAAELSEVKIVGSHQKTALKLRVERPEIKDDSNHTEATNHVINSPLPQSIYAPLPLEGIKHFKPVKDKGIILINRAAPTPRQISLNVSEFPEKPIPTLRFN